jgi:hypothetical protein
MPADEKPTPTDDKGLLPGYPRVPWSEISGLLGAQDVFGLEESEPDAPPTGG